MWLPIALFAFAAVAGVVLAIPVLSGRTPSLPVAGIHGLFAAAGIPGVGVLTGLEGVEIPLDREHHEATGQRAPRNLVPDGLHGAVDTVLERAVTRRARAASRAFVRAALIAASFGLVSLHRASSDRTKPSSVRCVVAGGGAGSGESPPSESEPPQHARVDSTAAPRKR